MSLRSHRQGTGRSCHKLNGYDFASPNPFWVQIIKRPMLIQSLLMIWGSMLISADMYAKEPSRSGFLVQIFEDEDGLSSSTDAIEIFGSMQMIADLQAARQAAPPCAWFSCYETLNFSLDEQCEKVLTAAMFLKDNAIALANPQHFKLTTTIGNGFVLHDNILRSQHIGQVITVVIEVIGPFTCRGSTCMTMVEVKKEKQPTIEETGSWTVYCNDPFLKMDPESDDYLPKPTVSQSCGGLAKGPTFAGDWIEVRNCVIGEEDTAKIIYREWYAESSDGVRISAMDTIYVLRLPPITGANLFCMDKDTIFCNVDNEQIGPYLLLPSPYGNVITECDTIYLMNADRTAAAFDAKCGLHIKVDSLHFSSGSCQSVTRYTVEVVQGCYGTTPINNPCTTGPGGSMATFSGGDGGPIYATCEFWLMELDTSPPVVNCDLSGFAQIDTINEMQVIIVGSGTDCSSSQMTLPNAIVSEDCNDIKLVKAIVDDSLGTITYTYDEDEGAFVPDTDITLPYRSEPYRVIFKAFDACHNMGMDSCFLLVKDDTRPVVAVHRGIHMEMNGKLTYLDVDQIDDDSYDNCEVLLVLGRRLDWNEGPLDICDSSRVDHTLVINGTDSLYCAILESDPAKSELEAYYSSNIDLLKYLNNPCGDLLAAAWQYDLCKYATVACEGFLNEVDFDQRYQTIYGTDNFSEIKQLGGGWAPKIPFDCNDACSEIDVELLVMDYWCNWSRSWTTVLVEDKTQAAVVVEATDRFALSCETFSTDSSYTVAGFVNPQPLSTIASLAENGDSAALSLLNDVWGGYEKAWAGAGAQYIDASGQVIDAQVMLTDHGVCTCTTQVVQVTYYDRDSDQFLQRDSVVRDCYVKDSVIALNNGIVLVNCNENTHCEQDVTLNLNECNLGTITRTFKIWKTCGNEIPDTVRRQQIIDIRNYCEITKDLFEFPRDTLLISCAPQYDPEGSGNVVGAAHPDSIGQPVYKLNDCRDLGLAHDDKVLSIINGNGTCYLVTRTWYFADWCLNSEVPLWWQNPNLVVDTCVQLIVLSDTTAPSCEISIADEVNDIVSAAICPHDLMVTFDLSDSCGLAEYAYRLDTLAMDGAVSLGAPYTGSGLLSENVAQIDITLEDLAAGSYRIFLRVIDACNNESICIDSFNLSCDISVAPGLVQGQVLNEIAEVIDHVQVNIESDDIGDISRKLDRNGLYSYRGAVNQKLDLKPIVNENNGDGISTADLILMQRHMLGLEILPTKYRRYAADINDDGEISNADVTALRRWVLEVDNAMLPGRSWRFYEEHSEQEVQSLVLSRDKREINWTGVKVGDLNLDADPRRRKARGDDPLSINLPDKFLEAGKRYHLTFAADRFKDMLGYQFTLELDQASLLPLWVEPSEGPLRLNAANFGTSELHSGILTTSWHATELEEQQTGVHLERNTAMFTLVVDALMDGYLSEVISINDKVVEAEAYDLAGDVHHIHLDFTKDQQVQDGFSLYQNRPNPFLSKTVIGFYLPEAANATITVFDAAGRMLKTYNGNYHKGYSEIEVKYEDLKARGVLYYQLDTQDFTATRRMLVID